MANQAVINFHCCPECGEWMRKSNETILQHLNEKHKASGIGKFHCPICIKPFARKWTVSRHIRSIHQQTPSNISTPTLSTYKRPQKAPNQWPSLYAPDGVSIRVLFGNNSPYPSCLQISTKHPPKFVCLNRSKTPSRT